MATITLGVTTTSTTDTTSYASASFTPAANDLLVVYVTASDSVLAAPTLSDSQGLGFTLVTSALYKTSLYKVYMFVANNLAAASAMTVTFDCTGDAATGTVISVMRVSGMTRKGIGAIRQSNILENGTLPGSAPTPLPTFPATTLTGNPTLVGVGNEESMSSSGMTGWTQRTNSSYITPTTFEQVFTRDSGFVGTSITWSDFGASAYSAIVAELDSSVASGAVYVERRFPNKRFGPLAITNKPRVPPIPYATAPGPQVYNSSLTAGLSFTGAQAKQTAYPHIGILSFSGAIAKRMTLAATNFTAGLSFIGVFIRRSNKSLTGALSFTGAISKLMQRALTASLGFVGSLIKQINYPLSGTLSFVGAFAKQATKSLSATLSFIGSLPVRIVSHLLSGILSFVGSIPSRNIGHGLTGTLSFTGNLSKASRRALTAALSFIGAIATNLIHGGTAYTQSLIAGLSFSGSVAKRANKSLTSNLSFTGAVARAITRALGGTLSFTGLMLKRIPKFMSATLSFSGLISSVKVLAATIFTRAINLIMSPRKIQLKANDNRTVISNNNKKIALNQNQTDADIKTQSEDDSIYLN